VTLPSSDMPTADLPRLPAVVFRGSKAQCNEFSLVLEAKAIDHEVRPSDGAWILAVAPSLVRPAYDEIGRYSAERRAPRRTPHRSEPFAGAAIGAMAYVLILLLTAYCAGIGWFGVDWLRAGALDAGAVHEWWRAVTALTLHLDQEHLLGNLLFGVFAGIAAGRLLGPGVAWASILGAGALANYTEILIAPADHRAVGASTAVFAALGMLAGLAWRQRLTLRERGWYALAPLIAGICLLSFLGAGTEHVDVLGHALGFVFGVGVGWLYARAGLPRDRSHRLQIAAGAGAAALIAVAWFLALTSLD
jgi:membrane associated rhomboid family serine protease